MSKKCKYFVSYARIDQKLVDELLGLLKTELKIVKNLQFSEWEDKKIVLGEEWKEQIAAAMQQSDFGILMLSPNFFDSDFIIEEELSHFLSQQNGKITILKPIVPVGIKPVELNGTRDLKGVEKIQIFRDQKNRWFNQVRGHTKDAFVAELCNKIIIKLGAQ